MSRAVTFKWSALLATAALLGVAVFPAFAGGWAVVTLDSLPINVVAGQPVNVGFRVRQHGQTLVPGLRPKVTVASAGPLLGGFSAIAVEDAYQVGHYTAALTFPSAGEWTWTIDAFGAFPQPMPELTVLAGAGAAARANSAQPISVPWVVIMIGLLGGAGGTVALLRTRAPLAGVVTVGSLLVALIGFAATSRQPAAVAAAADLPAAATSAETGRALFLAKGCIVCHQLSAVNEDRAPFADFSVGPNLSTYRLSPGYLTQWLFKPDAIKPNTQMPTLGLSDSEIAALVAFLDENMGR